MHSTLTGRAGLSSRTAVRQLPQTQPLSSGRDVRAAHDAERGPMAEHDMRAARAALRHVEPRQEPLRLRSRRAGLPELEPAAAIAVAHPRERVDRVAAPGLAIELAAPGGGLVAVHRAQRTRASGARAAAPRRRALARAPVRPSRREGCPACTSTRFVLASWCSSGRRRSQSIISSASGAERCRRTYRRARVTPARHRREQVQVVVAEHARDAAAERHDVRAARRRSRARGSRDPRRATAGRATCGTIAS